MSVANLVGVEWPLPLSWPAPAILHDRVNYAASMIDGRTVLEIDPRGRSAGEIVDLWTFVKARMHDIKKSR